MPALRAKQIRRLYEEGGIRSVTDLQVACRNNQLQTLKGIGPKMQAKIQAALGEFRRRQGYRLYASVLEEALTLEQNLAALRGVKRVSLTGALRRKMEVINEINFVVTLQKGQGTAAFLKALKAILNVTDAAISHGGQLMAIWPTGLPLTVILAQPTDHDFHLLQATGSVEHLEQLLQGFAEKGLRTWEEIYTHVKGMSEEAIYHAAGLPFVPAILREGRGEFALGSFSSVSFFQQHVSGRVPLFR